MRLFGTYRRDLGNLYGFCSGWIDGWYTSELYLLLDFPIFEIGPIIHFWWLVATANPRLVQGGWLTEIGNASTSPTRELFRSRD
jgi:hypothetical protein